MCINVYSWHIMVSLSQLCDKNHPRAKLLCSRQEHQVQHALQLENKGLPG